MTELQAIIGDYEVFLNDILGRVDAEGFDWGDFSQIDHMCYRVTSLDIYHQKKTDLASVAMLLGETMVNERPISTFRLHEPVRYKGWRIDAIELPSPKQGAAKSEGLEHIELVLFDDIPNFLQKYDGKPFQLQAADRGINPEVGLPLGDLTVKFHMLSLSTVVYLEHKLGINDVRDGQ